MADTANNASSEHSQLVGEAEQADYARGTVALITQAKGASGDVDVELAPIREALRGYGVDADIVEWTSGKSLRGYKAAIIRSPWDYPDRYTEFMAWLQKARQETNVLNHPDLITWNSDKHYLEVLADLGVNIPPTTYARTLEETQEAAAKVKGRLIIKPAVSASSRNTGLFENYGAEAQALAEKILSAGNTVIVQEAIDTVQDGAERGIFFFNGEYSHTTRKAPVLELGGGLYRGTYTERITIVEPSAAELELARATIRAIGMVSRQENWAPTAGLPLYIRVDVATPSSGKPQLIEAEAFEPELYLRLVEGGFDRFAKAVAERIEFLD
ncbi:carbamoyl phosphate synthase-like protein [Actinobaculum suis]|uniref:Carbamoyl phosphate synthase-like protein n=1 Tax=Actinobaculum suis TaxID=1657 RepID=A0A7Z8Y9N0_9ACTO|nr:hypothetical protein [Actinobaculum suis]VDG76544.1 carbamoyl phosphate synthase-like protein [Actinobaculum suis]